MTAESLDIVEIKAFVPAKDYGLSRRFYEDMGFEIPWSDEGLAYVRQGNVAFFLQNFYVAEHAGNFMMHMIVKDVDAWWRLVRDRDIVGKYGVRAQPPEMRPWRMRDFTLTDPTGVLWRIGQNVPPRG